MTNHKCCDCGKIIEPDKELRFFENDGFSGQTEGYLCEGCADRRLAEAPDPFYSESNMKALMESIQQFKDGKTVTKTLEELEAMVADMEDEENDMG